MTIPPLINLGGLSPVGAADCSMLPTIGPCLQPCTPERKGYYTALRLSLPSRRGPTTPPPPRERGAATVDKPAAGISSIKKQHNPRGSRDPLGIRLNGFRRQAMDTIREALHYAHQGGRLSRPLLGLDWVEEAARRCAGPGGPLPPRAHVAMCDCVWVKPYTHTQRVVQRLYYSLAACTRCELCPCALQVSGDGPRVRRTGQCQHAP